MQVTAGRVLSELKPEDWTRLSAGAGSKGPRLYDWALVRVNSHTGTLARWLLFRRSLADPTDVAHYLVHAPANTSLEAMVKAAGSRWPVEECFESGKGEVGLGDHEVRSYTGWYRHMTLCLVAHAYLAAARSLANAEEHLSPPKALGLPHHRSRMTAFRRRQGLLSSSAPLHPGDKTSAAGARLDGAPDGGLRAAVESLEAATPSHRQAVPLPPQQSSAQSTTVVLEPISVGARGPR